MPVKNSFLTIAALGALIYFIFSNKKGQAAAPADSWSGSSAPVLSTTTAQGVGIKETLRSPAAAVAAINTAQSQGRTIQPTSETLVKPTITATGTTGGVARLGTGAVVGITTTNLKGTTALDKVIAANYAASGAINKTYKSFWA